MRFSGRSKSINYSLMYCQCSLSYAFSKSILTAMNIFLSFILFMLWTISLAMIIFSCIVHPEMKFYWYRAILSDKTCNNYLGQTLINDIADRNRMKLETKF
ncbi:hypothetical protein S83_029370 [Arachis hypogaea]|nr:uncharacterized protein DS421_9g275020 [Arachis hypogaea]